MLVFIGIIYSLPAACQNGGRGVYQFLNTPYSARAAALGSDFLSVYDNDITLATANPSLINEKMDNSIGLNYVNYFNGINYGVAQYSKTFSKIGSFNGSLQYFNYGSFDEYDETDRNLGEFGASDLAVTLGWARKLAQRWTLGANFKAIYSSYYTYNSAGLGVDVALTYHNDEKLLSVSLGARNIGSQVKPYDYTDIEALPFNLQLAFSKGFAHLPFRIYAVIDDIDNWDLSYDDPVSSASNVNAITGEVESKSKADNFFQNAIKHVRVGGELTIAKRLDVRMGYNFLRRNDLKIEDKRSTVGLSWGLGLRLNRFYISYARSAYHLSGSPNWFSISTNLSNFK